MSHTIFWKAWAKPSTNMQQKMHPFSSLGGPGRCSGSGGPGRRGAGRGRFGGQKRKLLRNNKKLFIFGFVLRTFFFYHSYEPCKQSHVSWPRTNYLSRGVYIHTHTYTSIYIYICSYMYICVCVCVYVYIFIYIYVYIYYVCIYICCISMYIRV